MKKVIVTGGTGLIGAQINKILKENGYEGYSLTRRNTEDVPSISAKCDIFDEKEFDRIFSIIEPKYLLHLAWFTGENYLHSNINFDYINASLNILKYFKKYGGTRALLVGTCFEYDFKDMPIKEIDKLNPTTVYSKCKNILNELAKLYCENNNISYAWGRIFYVYGKNENEKRLIGSLIKNLKDDKEVVINSGELIRDYMYTKDIAYALVKALDSNIEGNVNICSNEGIKISDLVLAFARKLNKEHLVKFVDNVGDQAKIIIGDNSKLLSIGFKRQFTLDEAINDILGDIYE